MTAVSELMTGERDRATMGGLPSTDEALSSMSSPQRLGLTVRPPEL